MDDLMNDIKSVKDRVHNLEEDMRAIKDLTTRVAESQVELTNIAKVSSDMTRSIALLDDRLRTLEMQVVENSSRLMMGGKAVWVVATGLISVGTFVIGRMMAP